tara:strand:+ start:4101 stop:5168 length:1068 start_codon:yes stop_codon:yes gene_type:complete
MAFNKATGHGNLPNGNFSPVIYSQKVQKAFRKSSVVEDITNTDYMGEIANFGDSVKIIKEPEISVNTYARGTQIQTQDLEDSEFSLNIDQANYFSFKMDDIETAHSHVNFMDLATDRAGYKLRDTFDADVLAYMAGYVKNADGTYSVNSTTNGTVATTGAGTDELLAANKLDAPDFGGSTTAGTSGHSISLSTTTSGDTIATPLDILNRMARLMDVNNVDTADRWFVADPVFYELLMSENSKFVSADFNLSMGDGILRNGRVGDGLIRGFRVYNSNNLPFVGTGPATRAATNNSNYGIIIAGHNSAAATAQQIDKTETYRDPDSFADIVRGMQLYGRKILRSESIVTAQYNLHNA